MGIYNSNIHTHMQTIEFPETDPYYGSGSDIDEDFYQMVALLNEEVPDNNNDKDVTIDKDICIHGNDKYHLNKSDGILVCSECGHVKKNTIVDGTPEWRSDDNYSSVRCGSISNALYPKSTLGTKIKYSPNSSLGRMHNWSSSMPYQEKSLYIIFEQIRKVCLKYNVLICVYHDAIYYLKTVKYTTHKRGTNAGKYVITRRTNKRSLTAACFYHACKKNGYGYTVSEISRMFDVDDAKITKGRKTFLSIVSKDDVIYDLKFNKPSYFIVRLCKELNIRKGSIAIAKRLAINANDLDIALNHKPLSVASGIIYLVSIEEELFLNLDIISKFSSISTGTIKKTYAIINKYKRVLYDDANVAIIRDKMDNFKKSIPLPPKFISRLNGKYNHDAHTLTDYFNNK